MGVVVLVIVVQGVIQVVGVAVVILLEVVFQGVRVDRVIRVVRVIVGTEGILLEVMGIDGREHMFTGIVDRMWYM